MFILSVDSSDVSDRYRMQASFARTKAAKPPAGKTWEVKVALEIAQDGQGRNEIIPIVAMTLISPPEGVTYAALPDGTFALTVPRDVETVSFSIESGSPPFSHADITEVVAALNVTTDEDGK